eukprot:TRINITY_DN11630_c0_g1_i5.p2 TRINITY_DN11630_c0_g1~~TRINITY_DN11630_c0_g1_i5.p2  ORF type:complete len:139 (+),score=3.85 TRINITY_DN11630_c0_g1_i5:497-913(+)
MLIGLNPVEIQMSQFHEQLSEFHSVDFWHLLCFPNNMVEEVFMLPVHFCMIKRSNQSRSLYLVRTSSFWFEFQIVKHSEHVCRNKGIFLALLYSWWTVSVGLRSSSENCINSISWRRAAADIHTTAIHLRILDDRQDV